MNTKPVDISSPASLAESGQSVLDALARRQRRLKWLTALAVAFWSLAILTSIGVLVFYPIFYAPKERQMMQDYFYGQAAPGASAPSVTQRDMRHELGNQFIMTYVVTKGILIVAASVVILSCGTLATLLLVILHRRVTLQQINYSLAQISAQLKALQPPPPSHTPG